MTVNLYKINTENIRVDKSPYLGTATSYTADYGFEGNQNVETPSIIISSTAQPDYNYCYIDSFSRYYYIIAKTWVSDSLWRLSLLVDPLMSFKTDIGSQAGICAYSGAGSAYKYDPRLVYNDAPTVTATDAYSIGDPTGGTAWIVLSCRYFDDSMHQTNRCINQMSYLCFSPEAYTTFMFNFLNLTDDKRVAVSKTICSASVVHWLDFTNCNREFMSGTAHQPGQYSVNAIFSSPELLRDFSTSISIPVSNSLPADPFIQLSVDDYNGRTYVAFPDMASTYHIRKAQRLIDIPFIGQLSIDLDNLGVPLGTDQYYLACEISYDFGGGQYVVIPGYYPRTGSVSTMIKRFDALQCFTNGFTANFITDNSYQGEVETRTSQILGLIGTSLMGVVSAVATEGATIPATVASLGIGVANFGLTEQRLNYQQAASLGLSGSSNGGSYHNALIVAGNPDVKKRAAMYRRMLAPTTNIGNFQTKFGKPDGEYRTLSTLSGTGFCQLGTVILTGFTGATNNEKNMIRDALLTGVIL